MITEVKGVIHECNKAYSIFDEDTADYGAGWDKLNNTNAREEYRYRSAEELEGYPYWAVSSYTKSQRVHLMNALSLNGCLNKTRSVPATT